MISLNNIPLVLDNDTKQGPQATDDNKSDQIPEDANNVTVSHIFQDTSHCTSIDISQCACVGRIKIVLSKFMAKQIELTSLLNELFINNKYTNTKLLNDFHHIKYHHKTDDDDKQFDKIHAYIKDDATMKCDLKQCNHIERHHLDRSKLINEYTLPTDNNRVDNDDELYNEYT
eukprot:372099_1